MCLIRWIPAAKGWLAGCCQPVQYIAFRNWFSSVTADKICFFCIDSLYAVPTHPARKILLTSEIAPVHSQLTHSSAEFYIVLNCMCYCTETHLHHQCMFGQVSSSILMPQLPANTTSCTYFRRKLSSLFAQATTDTLNSFLFFQIRIFSPWAPDVANLNMAYCFSNWKKVIMECKCCWQNIAVLNFQMSALTEEAINNSWHCKNIFLADPFTMKYYVALFRSNAISC